MVTLNGDMRLFNRKGKLHFCVGNKEVEILWDKVKHFTTGFRLFSLVKWKETALER